MSFAKPQGLDIPARCIERMRLIREVEVIGSVAVVCRQRGISRQTYYTWKRRLADQGRQGLLDRRAAPSTGRPRILTIALAQLLLEQVKQSPRSGCVSLSKTLAASGIQVSSPTIQKALIDWGLRTIALREAWLKAGCPRVLPPMGTPESRVTKKADLAVAKNYFISGIPRGRGRNFETPRPTLADVAAVTSLDLNALRRVAHIENWEACQLRFLHRIEASEALEEMRRVWGNLDSLALSKAAEVLKAIAHRLQTSPELSIDDLAAMVDALRAGYRIFKDAFGGQLPSLLEAVHPTTGQHCAYPQAEAMRVWGGFAGISEDQIARAKRLFFQGLPGDAKYPVIPTPSLRQVAEFLRVPVRSLQRFATERGWVASRRETDRWFDKNYRAARLLNMHGPARMLSLLKGFFQIGKALNQRILVAFTDSAGSGDGTRLSPLTLFWESLKLFRAINGDYLGELRNQVRLGQDALEGDPVVGISGRSSLPTVAAEPDSVGYS